MDPDSPINVNFCTTPPLLMLSIHAVKPILNYALGLRFAKVHEQKREKNATGSCFYPRCSVI